MSRMKRATCVNCGDAVTLAGRSSRSGHRWCMRNECRAAKQRADRAYRARVAEVRGELVVQMEARPCSCCGTPLPVRPSRKTDIPLGRWCYALRCQAAKKKAVAAAETTRPMTPEEQSTRATYAINDFTAQSSVTCPECGRTDAVDTWQHPHTQEKRFCEGVGSKSIMLPGVHEIALARWRPGASAAE